MDDAPDELPEGITKEILTAAECGHLGKGEQEVHRNGVQMDKDVDIQRIYKIDMCKLSMIKIMIMMIIMISSEN